MKKYDYKDLVVGNYYSVRFTHNTKYYLWYFKFHSFEILKDDNFECISINIGDYYIENGLFRIGESFTYENDDIYEEVEFSLIVYFLPDSHPEKIMATIYNIDQVNRL